MRGKRPKLNKRLSKRQTLGLLADLMEQAEREQREAGGEPEEANPYHEGPPLAVPPPNRPGLRVADVPVDNSAAPEPAAADDPDLEPQAPLQQELPAQRQGDSSRHRSF
jgi:hypothetical protein